jgi:hypothetical protein
MTKLYRSDLPNVMHEIIDGEAVVANLDTGIYYGIEGIGAEIWELLGGRGRALEALIATIATRHPGAADVIEASVSRFVAELYDEGLIRLVDDEPDPEEPAPGPGSATTPFVEPTMAKYTDMEALMLADPIHEVDDEGWPNLK